MKVKDLKTTYDDIKVIRVVKPSRHLTKEDTEMKYVRLNVLKRDYGEYIVDDMMDYDKYKVTIVTIREK